MSRRFLAPIGGTGSLVGFTVLVTALAVCRLTGLVPQPSPYASAISIKAGAFTLYAIAPRL